MQHHSPNSVKIPEGIEFHNVAETELQADGGLMLFRVPRGVRQSLTALGRMVAEDSAGIEIRFVTDAPAFRISLGSYPSFLSPHERHAEEVVLFRGPFVHSRHQIEPGRVNHIDVAPWSGGQLPEHVGTAKRRGFSPNVWRVFMGRCVRVFYGLETFGYAHRKPLPDELPSRRWLAYGSSITNGASPVSHLSSYVYHAARAADLDVLNLGLSGSCFCEPEMADFIGSRQDYEIATLEVGVNMRNGVSPQDFRARVSYLLDAVAAPGANRQVFLVTVYPNLSEAGLAAAQDRFSAILRELVASGRWQKLSLIEGGTILDDPGDLTADYIHPSDYGHARMGYHLGKILSKTNA